ncbi:hypothetical protein GCM10010094_36800 [Streptomyces flaveus]|uniref:Uncharacterized protein n=1 Tax=Streptomyces flaveus TaxID=66370 RepID=A0A917VGD0_9ACTN|nr:hypothetical protein GCM10010094_36800 [Streptomyces flaveus]
MCADARRGAVHRGDHRFLAVEDGGDEALGAETDDPGHIAGDPFRGGWPAAQVGARTETAARRGEYDGTYVRVGGGFGKKLDQAFSLVRGDGVHRLGPIEGDPRDLIVSGVPYQ